MMNLKWSLFWLSNLTCAIVLYISTPIIKEHALSSLYQYYGPLIPLIFMLWFWAINVWWFERNHVPYEECFEPDIQKYLLRSGAIFDIAGTMTTLFSVNLCCCVYFCALSQYESAGYCALCLYAVAGLFLVAPVNYMHKDVRQFFSVTVVRVLVPIQPVNFADFLLADVMTSLAKPMADIGQNVCYMFNREKILFQNADATDEKNCGSQNWFVTFLLLYPFISRFIQCFWDYFTKNKTAQVFNAIKYSTAFPAAYFLMQYTIQDSTNLRVAWVCAQLLNTCYSYYWDVERDWDISWFSGVGLLPQFKLPKLFQAEVYYYGLISNFVLRLGWSYKLSSFLKSSKMVVLMMTSLEVFRRFQWIYIRIETELRKIGSRDGKNLIHENGDHQNILRVKSHNVMSSTPLF